MAIGHLCGFLEDKWLFLVRLDSNLPVNLNVNEENKFEVDILKNVAKIVNFRPKIGQL